MGVHNLAEYVKYHQQKLRQSSSPTQTSSQSSPRPGVHVQTFEQTTIPKTGVDELRSKKAFDEAVIERVDAAENAKDRLVMVDFFATWCGPCKMIAPKIAEWAEGDFNGQVDFYKLDVDQVPEVAQEYDVRAMPTFLFFKNGKVVEDGSIVGANPKALLEFLQKNV